MNVIRQRLTSPSNARVKALVRLQQKSSARRSTGRFCVETPRILNRARQAGLRAVEFYFDPLAFGDEALLNHIVADGAQVFEITSAILSKVAYRQHPEGFIAVFEAGARALNSLNMLLNPLLVVCSGLEKPGNLGAILRSADGAGVDAVLVDRPVVDLFNPNCVRASTGAVFSVPVVADTPEALQRWLRARQISLVAATPDAQALYTDTDLTGPVAIVMGAEAEGLSASWRAAADRPVRLPMMGITDSLNVSVAAAVLMYEAARQRG